MHCAVTISERRSADDHRNPYIRPRHADPLRTALASSGPADTIQDGDAGQQMSAGPSIPVSR